MNIGIIGKGKMGRSIFDYLLQFDHQLVLVCHKKEDVIPVAASIEKQIQKRWKRGFLTDEEYERKIRSYKVADCLAAVKKCSLVIESVSEEPSLKQNIFQGLEGIVAEDCILATNTSSIPLQMVFAKCLNKERCLGMHFFFPIQVMRTVEINTTLATAPQYIKIVHKLLEQGDKTPLLLEDKANMMLTKLFTILITRIYNIYEERVLPIDEIDAILKANLFTFGLFEIIDSTGIPIILTCIDNFVDERYRELYTPFYNKGVKLLQAGYPGGTGHEGIASYEREHPEPFQELNAEKRLEYQENMVLRLQSMITNELAFLLSQQDVGKDSLLTAVQEVLGLGEDPRHILETLGVEPIENCLWNEYALTRDPIYLPLDFSFLRKIPMETIA